MIDFFTEQNHFLEENNNLTISNTVKKDTILDRLSTIEDLIVNQYHRKQETIYIIL